ncbi:MAG: glycoside hydrolase family 16 protein [Flavobacteriaceae bacterium]
MKYLNRYTRFSWISKSKIAMIAFVCITFLGLTSCENDEVQTVTTLTNLVWSDEFDTDGPPDATKWAYVIGNGAAEGIPGWGNQELQYYTDRLDNVVVENGMLKIIAKQESFMGSGYTSGRITTKGLFQQAYGRFEARIKLPWSKGLWPAFWMLGDDSGGAEWPQIGEIDIMEYKGSEPTITHGSVHGPGYFGGNPITKTYELPSGRFDTEFHVFGVEWGANYVNYYVDDVLFLQITPDDLEDDDVWVFNDNPFHMILNVAVGGSFSGFPDASSVFPQTMLVDYVRVYQ